VFFLKHEQLFYKLQVVLQSKVDEFQYLNYPTITKEELWHFCVEKKWRKKNVDDLRLYELVATVFSVTPSEVIAFMNRKSIETSRSLADINPDELEMLIGKKPIE
jgi:hypothetical protein